MAAAVNETHPCHQSQHHEVSCRRVLALCRAEQPDLLWEGVTVTARFGVPYVASEGSYAVAAHAVLDAFETCNQGHGAVLMACFGDPGPLAQRELASVPALMAVWVKA